jgi:hypothetical protein
MAVIATANCYEKPNEPMPFPNDDARAVHFFNNSSSIENSGGNAIVSITLQICEIFVECDQLLTEIIKNSNLKIIIEKRIILGT